MSLDRKELKVCCDSPAMAQQLQFDQETIVERLNERLGGNYIRSIRPASVGVDRLGPGPGSGPEPAAEAAALPAEVELAGVAVPEAQLRALRERAAALPADQREGWLRTAQRLVRLRAWREARGYKACGSCGALHNDLLRDCYACRVGRREDPAKG